MTLFADDLTLAQKLAKNEPLLHQSISRYFESFNIKQEILYELQTGASLLSVLPRLRLALADEIADVIGCERDENAILEELSILEKRHHVLSELISKLQTAERSERLEYHFLRQLHLLLRSQATTLKAVGQPSAESMLRSRIMQQLEQEKQIIQQLRQIPDIDAFYKKLAIGEWRKHNIEAREEYLVAQLTQHINDELLKRGSMQKHVDKQTEELTRAVISRLGLLMIKQALEEREGREALLAEEINGENLEKNITDLIEHRGLSIFYDQRVLHDYLERFREIFNTEINAEE